MKRIICVVVSCYFDLFDTNKREREIGKRKGERERTRRRDTERLRKRKKELGFSLQIKVFLSLN